MAMQCQAYESNRGMFFLLCTELCVKTKKKDEQKAER